MITRYYVRQIKDNNQYIGCYDVEHTTDTYSGMNGTLQVALSKGFQVIAFLDAIALSKGGTNDS